MSRVVLLTTGGTISSRAGGAGVVATDDAETIGRLAVRPGSNVQEHVVLHTDIGFPLRIGRGCTIGHRAVLHGCTIGDNSLIGMGAIVLNGARIGSNCLQPQHEFRSSAESGL